MNEAEAPTLAMCKCGHSGASHNTGKPSRYRNGSLWACFAPECDCQIFETLEDWADRMARACPHCGGSGKAPTSGQEGA